jgi:hypothetical protein
MHFLQLLRRYPVRELWRRFRSGFKPPRIKEDFLSWEVTPKFCWLPTRLYISRMSEEFPGLGPFVYPEGRIAWLEWVMVWGPICTAQRPHDPEDAPWEFVWD